MTENGDMVRVYGKSNLETIKPTHAVKSLSLCEISAIKCHIRTKKGYCPCIRNWQINII